MGPILSLNGPSDQPGTIHQHYEQQFEALTKQREHMRTLIAKWWTLMEERH